MVISLILNSYLKVMLIFPNGTSYFSLHILVAYLESFPKHYNIKYFFIKNFLRRMVSDILYVCVYIYIYIYIYIYMCIYIYIYIYIYIMEICTKMMFMSTRTDLKLFDQPRRFVPVSYTRLINKAM